MPPGVAVEITGCGNFDGLTLDVGGCTVRGLAIDDFGGNGIVINNPSGTDSVYNCNIGTDLTGTAQNVGNSGDGILITGSNNNIGFASSGNVISGNGGNGIELSGSNATSNTVTDNFIGVDSSGTVALKNTLDGVLLDNGSGNNCIGDTNGLVGNTISGNGQNGVEMLGSDNNQVVDNYIGLGSDGCTVVANGRNGVRLVSSASGNDIGMAYAGNVISGNTQNGIVLSGDTGVSCNSVVCNLIGTDYTATVPKSNLVDGIFVNAPDNTIGGVNTGTANTIAGNGRYGINVSGSLATGDFVDLNFIGTNDAGAMLGNGNDGIYINADYTTVGVAGATDGQGNRIATVISSNGNYGIEIIANHNTIVNCYIGVAQDGSTALGNTAGGIAVLGGATDNTIGGTSYVDGNVISGNNGIGIAPSSGSGIYLARGSSDTTIAGNMIGTDVSGTQSVKNAMDGIFVELGSTYNTIGLPGVFNVISGNGNYGIEVDGTNNYIDGNYVGIDIYGFPLENGQNPNNAPNPSWWVDNTGGNTNFWGNNNYHN